MAAATATPCAASPCPINTLQANQVTVSTADSAAYLSDTQSCDYWLPGAGNGTARFDLVSGIWYVSAYVSGECSASAELGTRDSFTLIGPAGASGVEFTARLDVTLHYALVTLREGADNQQSTTLEGGFAQVLEVRIQRNAGQTFDLHVSMSAAAWPAWSEYAYAYLTFPDLPAGWAVRSCQGYVSDVAVPAGTVSWGRIKAIYR